MGVSNTGPAELLNDERHSEEKFWGEK
jgi:hypothetical protein